MSPYWWAVVLLVICCLCMNFQVKSILCISLQIWPQISIYKITPGSPVAGSNDLLVVVTMDVPKFSSRWSTFSIAHHPSILSNFKMFPSPLSEKWNLNMVLLSLYVIEKETLSIIYCALKELIDLRLLILAFGVTLFNIFIL